MGDGEDVKSMAHEYRDVVVDLPATDSSFVLRDRVENGTTITEFVLEASKDVDPSMQTRFFKNAYPSFYPFVDIGAHVGLYVIARALVLKHVHGRTPGLVAVEPDQANRELLIHNIEANGLTGLIQVIPKALWSRSGETLQLRTCVGNSGGSSVVVPHGGESYDVETISLRDILKHVPHDFAHVKIDVEGAEFRALPATSPSTFARIGVLDIEYHPMESDYGFGFAAMMALDEHLKKHIGAVYSPPVYKHFDYRVGDEK